MKLISMPYQNALYRFLMMFIGLMCVACSGAQDTDKIATITKAALEIERTVMMPEGADTIDKYSRYYALSTINDRQVVIGTFMSFEPAPSQKQTPLPELSGAYFVDDYKSLNWFNDGGCGVVTVYFDLKNNQLVGFTKSRIMETVLGVCNGEA